MSNPHMAMQASGAATQPAASGIGVLIFPRVPPAIAESRLAPGPATATPATISSSNVPTGSIWLIGFSVNLSKTLGGGITHMLGRRSIGDFVNGDGKQGGNDRDGNNLRNC